MKFCNFLPEDCPPKGVDGVSLSNVYRILASNQPVIYDWLTHTERGAPKPDGVCACRWGSLSLTTDLAKSKKWPSLRQATHAAKLEIPENAGVHMTKKHKIDFWRDENIDVSTFVTSVDPI